MSYVLTTFFSKKAKVFIFCLVLTVFVTPENLGIGSEKPAPAIFSFTFDLFFQQKLSLSTLRPLVFILPFSISVAFLIYRFKKRFFQG
tara:strand:+ start:149 stop:412 length:264 start_codon:yes stop_codon:yes gene_type:complete